MELRIFALLLLYFLRYTAYAVDDDVFCEKYDIIAGPDVDVIFDCHRNTTQKVPLPIEVQYQHPPIEATNADVTSWFGEWDGGVVNEHYNITIDEMKAGRYEYNIIPQSSKKPRILIKIYVDAPLVSEDSQPYDKVMRLGETTDNFLPCSIKSDHGYSCHFCTWSKIEDSTSGICIWHTNPPMDKFTWSGNMGKWFSVSSKFSLVFTDVSFDHAGQYKFGVDLFNPGIVQEYYAYVIVTDSTNCSSSHAFQGETVYLQCSVTYQGNRTSNLQITDINGNVLGESSPEDLRLSGGHLKPVTHELTVPVTGLPVGNHSYNCRNSFPGFNFTDDGCLIDVTIDADDVVCEKYDIITGPDVDVIFDCHRSTAQKVPLPIEVQYQWPPVAANNVEVKSWFGEWSEGLVKEHYQITIDEMKAGRYEYNIIPQSSSKPKIPIKVYIDAPLVSEDSQPYDKVMRLGETIDNYLPCTIKSDLGYACYFCTWWKIEVLSHTVCIWNTYPPQDKFTWGFNMEEWFRVSSKFSLAFRDVSFDHAGQYKFDVKISNPGIVEEYYAHVIVTDSTNCSSSHAFQGETVYLQCSVTYQGNGTSNLQITDINGNVLGESSLKDLRLSGGNLKPVTEELTVSITGLPIGNHSYICRNSFPGFNFTDDGCLIDITIETLVTAINISAANMYLYEGESSTFGCNLQLMEIIPYMSLVWTLNGKKISNGLRFEVDDPIIDDTNQMVSNVHIKNVYPRDTGTIECVLNVAKQINISSAMMDIYVLACPRVEISNFTYTIMEGDDLTLTCRSRVERTGHPDDTVPAIIKWYRNNQEIKDDNEQGEVINQNCTLHTSTCVSHLYKSNAKDVNVTYSCDARNDAGSSQRLFCDVVLVSKEIPICENDNSGKLSWPKTKAGSTATLPCAGLSSGKSYRKCLENGTWDQPNYDFCVDEAINDVLKEISDMEDGLDANVNQTKSVALELEEVASNVTTTSEPMKPGNINASIEALDRLTGVHLRVKDPPEHEEVQSITDVCSMLIEEKNHDSWTKIRELHPQKAATIMSSLEGYGDALTKSTGCKFPMDLNTYSSENIVMILQSWTEGNGDIIYPKREMTNDWIESSTDQVNVKNDTLTQIMAALNCENIAISSTYYRTLGPLLPQKLRNKEATVSSKVLAIRVTNLTSEIKFETPISITFETEKVKLPYQPKPNCAFWNYTEHESGSWSTEGCHISFDDESMTNCRCDHLTNFAILVSSQTVHHLSLSIITYVGCGLSVICMVITVIVYTALWKPLQMVVRGNSSRALMLIALCVVLTLANLLFLFGVEQTQPSVLCIIIAACLHYLFLVAFALMLAFSLQLFLKIVWFKYMISPDSKKQIRWILVLAFALPAIIVVVTVAMAQTQGLHGYTTQDFCWLSVDGGVIYAFVGPVALIIVINTVVMVVVLVTKYKSKASGMKTNSNGASMSGEMISESLWTIAVLTPMMGITWMIGIFAVNEHTVVLQYMFSLLNSAQGVFIFIFHCVLDASVKKAWHKRFPAKSEETSMRTLSTESRGRI